MLTPDLNPADSGIYCDSDKLWGRCGVIVFLYVASSFMLNLRVGMRYWSKLYRSSSIEVGMRSVGKCQLLDKHLLGKFAEHSC